PAASGQTAGFRRGVGGKRSWLLGIVVQTIARIRGHSLSQSGIRTAARILPGPDVRVTVHRLSASEVRVPPRSLSESSHRSVVGWLPQPGHSAVLDGRQRRDIMVPGPGSAHGHTPSPIVSIAVVVVTAVRPRNIARTHPDSLVFDEPVAIVRVVIDL